MSAFNMRLAQDELERTRQALPRASGPDEREAFERKIGYIEQRIAHRNIAPAAFAVARTPQSRGSA